MGKCSYQSLPVKLSPCNKSKISSSIQEERCTLRKHCHPSCTIPGKLWSNILPPDDCNREPYSKVASLFRRCDATHSVSSCLAFLLATKNGDNEEQLGQSGSGGGNHPVNWYWVACNSPCRLLDVVREVAPREAALLPRHDAAQELVAEALALGEERRLPPLGAGDEPLAAQPLLLVLLPEPRVLLLVAAATATPRRRLRASHALLLRAVEPKKPPPFAERLARRTQPPYPVGSAKSPGATADGRGRAGEDGRRAQEAPQPHRPVHRGSRRAKRRGIREQARSRVRACSGRVVNSGVCRVWRRSGW